MSQKHKYAYILLTDTGTWFSRIIRFFTRQELNHASIALDSELKQVYSFGRKRADNPFRGGFVKENIRGSLFGNANCEIYRCRLSESEYQKMKTVIKRFERRAPFFRYNLTGLIGVLLNRPIQPSCAYFCSQFVATVFERAGRPLVQKCPVLTKPVDLTNSEQVELYYRGSLHFYLRSPHLHLPDLHHPKSQERIFQDADVQEMPDPYMFPTAI